jgi:hypothetical protein
MIDYIDKYGRDLLPDAPGLEMFEGFVCKVRCVAERRQTDGVAE